MSLMGEEENYEVEKVVGKCIIEGKWLGFDSENNTWEPDERLDCAELIKIYEDFQTKQTKEGAVKDQVGEQKIKSRPSVPKSRCIATRDTGASSCQTQDAAAATSSRASSTSTRASKRSLPSKARSKGFARVLQVKRILGVTSINDELQFLIKWAGDDQADLVPAEEANIMCPQLVLKYYQERIRFVD